MTKTIYHLRIAHHMIKVFKVTIRGDILGRADDYVGYNYAITGGGWNWGCLHSEDMTPKRCLKNALRRVREDHPRAKERWTKGRRPR